MKLNKVINRTNSRRFVSGVFLLMLVVCGVAIGQRSRIADATATITARIIPLTSSIGEGISLVSSMLQEIDSIGGFSVEDVSGPISHALSVTPSLPVITETGLSLRSSDALDFEIEEVYLDPLQGVSAILGSDGKLYVRRPSVDDHSQLDAGVTNHAKSVLMIVSVVE